ncbi:hypothetical protein [Streptomyces sp. DH12]|uniref:hypothetical protein n=1 Tax=Streptomyces sp. DH12 TaxID=2857010 RepID=UPI001E5CC80D|nr:hypothetical protein [Streptomyces sp. DH12]
MADPITPTRIIPAGAPLPAQPDPGGAPPRYMPPPAPAPAPAPAPGPVEVRVTVDLAYPYAQPEPTRWERLTTWLGRFGKPWQAVGGLLLAVVPIPWTGHSAASTWAYTVHLARDIHLGYAYALALIPLAIVVRRILRHGGTVLRLWALAVTAIGGLTGALHWFDLITFLTGVHR